MMRRGIFGKKHETKTKIGKVFGVSIVDVCQRQESEIPLIMKDINEYLEEKGLTKEGIFRIPGNATVLEQLKAHYDGEQNDVTLDSCDDVHAVGCLLKLYLRELPEPLLTFRFYDTLISIQKNNDILYRMTNIRKIISALPNNHKQVLCSLCVLLRKIAEHSSENKMSIANLAIVLGPNLLRPRHESMLRMVEDSRHINGIIQSILEEYEFLVLGKGEPPCEPSSVTGDIDTDDTTNLELDLPKESGEDKLQTMQENAATRKAELEGETRDIVLVICPDFDLENPGPYATGKLKAKQQEEERPFDLHKMTPAQLVAEKKYLKWLLRNYDLAFQHRYGHFPIKGEKEALRPLYDRYRGLNDLLANSEAAKENEEENENIVLSDTKDIDALKNEKKELQRVLIKYQTDFANQNRRPVEFIQDREPLQKEYARYREIKKFLVTAEGN